MYRKGGKGRIVYSTSGCRGDRWLERRQRAVERTEADRDKGCRWDRGLLRKQRAIEMIEGHRGAEAVEWTERCRRSRAP